MSIQKAKIVNLPKIEDERGILSFLEGNKQVPFEIKRVFYAYQIPQNLHRGAHAHKLLQQFMIPLSGNFSLELDDGKNKMFLELKDPSSGIYIPPMIWVNITSTSVNSIYLVLASDIYDESDYYRNYSDFLKASSYAD